MLRVCGNQLSAMIGLARWCQWLLREVKREPCKVHNAWCFFFSNKKRRGKGYEGLVVWRALNFRFWCLWKTPKTHQKPSNHSKKTKQHLLLILWSWIEKKTYIFWDFIVDISHLCFPISVKCCQELSNCLARLKPLQPQPRPVERNPTAKPSPKKMSSSPASIRHGVFFFVFPPFLVARIEDGSWVVVCTYVIL